MSGAVKPGEEDGSRLNDLITYLINDNNAYREAPGFTRGLLYVPLILKEGLLPMEW